MKNIKFSKNSISAKDIVNVKSVIKSGWLTHGKFTNLFERKFSEFTKSKFSLTVSSCTAGLHISCIAAGFSKGDEVIVPSMTHTATAHAVEYTGAKAVFADVETISGNVNLDYIKKKVTSKTKGLIVVHMAGLPCDLKPIIKFCKKKNITLLEDCAHALGTTYQSKHVGNFGLSGCFSFYPTKQITTGEGGIVVTNNENFYNKIKKLKAFGIDTDVSERKVVGDYDVKSLGFNYRMTDFQAALGYGQIVSYKKNLKKRINIAKRYVKNFSKTKQILFTPFSKNNSYFIFQIFCKNRNKILEELKKKQIGISVHYMYPLPSMSYYKKKYRLARKHYLNASQYANTNISLPVYPSLTMRDVDYISKTIISLTNNEK
jgi:perosamine synthetase